MMITAHKKSHAKRIPGPTKLDIALQAIRRQQTVSAISKHFNCSRTTVYKQQAKALDAANQAFEKDAACRLFLRNLPGHPSPRQGQKQATSMPPAALAVLVPLDFDPPSGLKIYAPQ